jgi:hypothetical protein
MSALSERLKHPETGDLSLLVGFWKQLSREMEFVRQIANEFRRDEVDSGGENDDDAHHHRYQHCGLLLRRLRDHARSTV